jgi:large subunit ribosomal protein L29
MAVQDLRAKDDAALQAELIELRREAFNLRMQRGTGQLPRPSQFRAARKEIARIKTILNERRRAGARPSEA